MTFNAPRKRAWHYIGLSCMKSRRELKLTAATSKHESRKCLRGTVDGDQPGSVGALPIGEIHGEIVGSSISVTFPPVQALHPVTAETE